MLMQIKNLACPNLEEKSCTSGMWKRFSIFEHSCFECHSTFDMDLFSAQPMETHQHSVKKKFQSKLVLRKSRILLCFFCCDSFYSAEYINQESREPLFFLGLFFMQLRCCFFAERLAGTLLLVCHVFTKMRTKILL